MSQTDMNWDRLCEDTLSLTFHPIPSRHVFSFLHASIWDRSSLSSEIRICAHYGENLVVLSLVKSYICSGI